MKLGKFFTERLSGKKLETLSNVSCHINHSKIFVSRHVVFCLRSSLPVEVGGSHPQGQHLGICLYNLDHFSSKCVYSFIKIPIQALI